MAEDGLDKSAGGPFPLGTCDMNHRELVHLPLYPKTIKVDPHCLHRSPPLTVMDKTWTGLVVMSVYDRIVSDDDACLIIILLGSSGYGG